MTPEVFKNQMERLKTQWPSAYGEERTKLLFHALKTTPDWFMESVVTKFISESRQAPLLPDFLERIAETTKVEKERNLSARHGLTEVRGRDFLSQLEAAAKRAENKEYARECLKILRLKLSGQINAEQFEQALKLLDTAKPGGCNECNGSGYSTPEDKNGYRFLKRCKCEAGDNLPEMAYGPRRQDGTREEVFIPR